MTSIRQIRYFRIMVSTITIILVQCAAILSAQDRFHGWKVDSRVKSLQLESVEESGTLIEFAFKNISDKVISAYSICFSRDSESTSCHDSDWFETEIGGLPHAGVDRLSIGQAEADEYKNRVLEIAAVLLDDGTAEGLIPQISSIELKQLGRAVEMRRLSNILASFATRTLNDSDLGTLANEVGAVPERLDQGIVDDLRSTRIDGLVIPEYQSLSEGLRLSLFAGVRNARIDMIRTIEDLRLKPLSSPGSNVVTRSVYFTALQRHYAEYSTRMIDISKRRQGGKQK